MGLKFANAGAVDLELLNPIINAGFLKHAFVLSYYFLKLLPQKSYSECIAETMAFAGDTDTNGAIVGGMIGSCIGRQDLPTIYVETILDCLPKKGGKGIIMPDEVQPARTYQ